MTNSKNIVVIGATSAIAQGISALYAEARSKFLLVARDEGKTLEIISTLKHLGAQKAAVFITDLRLRENHDAIVEAAAKEFGKIDVVLFAHGIYPDMQMAEQEVDVMLDVMMTNAVSTLSLMHRFGQYMKAHQGGTIAVLSSVAGERGRRNNYIYGTSKAALTAYASGMRASYAGSGVHILTILPGPVDTPMTVHRKMPLTVSVNKVSMDIVQAINRRKHVLYTPWYWRYIMFFIKMLPERIFMKLNL